ncbi:sugar-transfer associated ATP-grasp domain-containing protein [Phaeodactylibacter xiamenensis]|uniref:sugar-transfer associated ATP-grasp domain-containing protein n=1 Tax=Phaeodactylibacter xiamenensis TaxID=1524460 RepID=UPI003BAD9C37
MSLISQWYHSIRSVFRYNISIEEYYQFRFYELQNNKRDTYAGTGYMYEYQRRLNPPVYRATLADKTQFLEKYRDFVRHEFLTLEELENHPEKSHELLKNPSGKIVLKSSDGQCGRGIEVRQSRDFTPTSLVQRLKATGNDFVEAFVTQHPDLMRLSPSGLNTVRIITQLDKNDQVHIIGTRLRISVNSAVDNLAAGNIAASIDSNTGKVNGPGVYSDITRSDEYQHPITGVDIVGFQIPYWQETLDMCKSAALLDTRNRSIGWDVAITDDGPELIEGNHDWCKLLWQLPVKKGLKPILESFTKELQQ